MSVLVIAEKPSVARDIAEVLGARGNAREDGCFRSATHIVTWAIGHLVTLAEPHEMNPSWKKWRLLDLPLLPASWPLVVQEATRKQFEVVRALMVSREVTEIVCATDAGREGELIFRYIYEAARCKKKVRRLWISSLTADAITRGFGALRDGAAFDRLGDAARARSRADWLVGMNLSRAYSLLHDDNLSVGRVQTPTLAMVVARELEIRAFVPEDYLEVVARFEPRREAPGGSEAESESKAAAATTVSYEGTYVRPKVRAAESKRLPPDGKEAAKLVERAKRGLARIDSVERETRRIPPPLLYDLTELQRHANRLYGFTAQRTLDIAQGLYERRKLISYPRTDSRHLSQAVAETLPAIVNAIAPPYRGLLADGTGTRPLGPRFVDDARVSDHHAILPTDAAPPASLTPDERKLYDLVCRRLLAAWHEEHVYAVTTVQTVVTWNDARDGYVSSGTSVENEGWKKLDVKLSRANASSATSATAGDGTLPGGLTKGMLQRVLEAKAVAKKTKPPPRHTDASLLTAMETAGRALDEKEISEAMRERGLGTPATRASILETLLKREYITRDGKALHATDKGVALIGVVHAHVKSPAMTGEWEAKLARIERGEGELGAFMAEIERYVREVIGNVAGPAGASASSSSRSSFEASMPASDAFALTSGAPLPPAKPRPARPTDLGALLRESFGFSKFRPYQEDVCRTAAAGHDVLLVMPTGAGKSLCYQLPGVARGGTTLVISPLIALMEDQVTKLIALGFSAARIHSGRDRADSRASCKAYLDGTLDFLFIAPERLKVPGFPEMLARRKPALIAIDEAHCISQWGHDFRPDYRMLGDRLPLLRPSPVIALTATATPTVQDDIVSELRLTDVKRFIHGFRRTNIGVEVVERSPGDRAGVVRSLLASPGRTPAIVYAPTRKDAEELARELKSLGAVAYHAGLRAPLREEIQSAFLGGKLEIIVATIAFGMGVDKADVRTVVHAALPATVEGYYQEIGRAGRDGNPSRAVLLHSFVDTKTHEFFLERDYPEAEVLARIQSAVPTSGVVVSELGSRSGTPPAIFEKALDKLWVHGGVTVDAEDMVRRGDRNWEPAYAEQRAHRRGQLDKMRRYADTTSCRMLQLVSHFGDRNDDGTPCGLCDVCAPSSAVAQLFRAPSAKEQEAVATILEALHERDGRAIGQLHRELFTDGARGAGIDRRALEHILGALARAGEVRIVQDEFVKDGETITFQRVHLSTSARLGMPRARTLQVLEAPARTKPGRALPKAKRGAKRARKTPRAPSESRAGVTRSPRTAPEVTYAPSGLVDLLRAWRAGEAKRRGIPAFRILTDRTLMGIASARPHDEDGLLEVSGMGPSLLKKYGKALLSLLSSTRSG